MINWKYTTALATLGLIMHSAPALAEEIDADDLLDLSLEELSNIEVTSVSKRSEKASEAAAAIYVVTQDEIRRSGATSIPEALRMVPGLSVAQSGARQWAISSRGFNDQFANKLLVLIDGRSVYTPLFSGVNWDVQDTLLEDIDRIEVIRGPGATLWGANAVNGIINIITKSAEDTQGTVTSLTVGNQINAIVSGRHGAKIGDNAHVRMYGKHNDYQEVPNLAGGGARDAWNKSQSGFRADWEGAEGRSYTLQGDLYRMGASALVTVPFGVGSNVVPNRETLSGANILGRYTNTLADNSEVSFQAYYDLARRDNFIASQTIQTFDLDGQYLTNLSDRHELIVGAGYRFINYKNEGNTYLRFADTNHVDHLYSAFIQDKITILKDELFLTLGSKFEHNEYTGFEFQPSARFSWLIDDKQTFWGSVSRALHTPDRGTASDSQLIVGLAGANTYLTRVGNDALDSEELIAYELGYRIQPASNISVDAAVFYNDYDNLFLGSQGTPFAQTGGLGAYVVVPIIPVNTGSARSWGGELSFKWNPYENVALSAAYSLVDLKFDQADPLGFSFAGKSPEQQFNTMATFTLPHNLELNTAAYYVDELRASGTDHYVRLDARLAWQATENMELSLVGQNLLDNQHPEFTGFLYQSVSQVPRAVYGNVSWKF